KANTPEYFLRGKIRTSVAQRVHSLRAKPKKRVNANNRHANTPVPLTITSQRKAPLYRAERKIFSHINRITIQKGHLRYGALMYFLHGMEFYFYFSQIVGVFFLVQSGLLYHKDFLGYGKWIFLREFKIDQSPEDMNLDIKTKWSN